MNIASRSGTNQYHGSIFEQHRNKALNSNTFFGERAGLDKPPFVQNNFGGSMGGPVLRNKLFFFGSYEGYRNREGVLFRRTVPTAAMKAGDFSDYRGSGQTVVPIYDPWTQCGITNPGTGVFNGVCGAPGVPNRQQFPGNIIPANRISPIAKKFLAFPIYAEPTVAGRWTTNNFEKNASIGGDNNQVNVRGDYNMSQNNRIIGRYTRFDSTNLPVDVYGNGQTNGDPYSPEHFITTQVMVADTYSFNSSTVLDVRFGVMRWDYDRTPGNLGTDPVATFGLPVVPYGQIPERSDGVPATLPAINAGSNQVIGTGLIYADDYTYSLTPTLTKIMGAHTVKAGANILNGEVNYFQNNNVGGTFTFANNPTALDGTAPGATGDPFASFLIGQQTGGTYQSSNFNYGRTRYQAYFVEDSWQMNARLTVNLGMRLEKPGAFFETEDRLVTFNPDLANPLLAGKTNPETGKPYLGAYELVASSGQPERTLRKNPLQFAPRVGVAYRLGENTVLRAGGGTFYVPSTVRFPDGPTGNPVNIRTNNIATSVDNNRTFFTDMSNPFPTGVDNYPGRDPSFQQVLLGGTGNQYYRDEEGYPGRTQQFNAALQHQFANQLSVEVAYVGLRGSHLPATLNQNQLGLDLVNRAANDTTVCSLTGNVVIPQGQPGYTSSQRDTCYGAYLRQTVPNPFVGIVREGALSTPTVQRNLLLVNFPQYTSASEPGYFGESSYNALQLRADKRFGAGSVISANYTFSRNYGNVETVTGWLESGAGNPAAGYQTNDLENEFALSSFDVPHRFVFNYVLDLPFGAGRRFGGGATGISNTLISGWTLSGFTTLQAGYPLAFTATPNLIGSGYGLRPNVDPNCDKQVSGSAVDRLNRWFNTSCFSVPNAAFVAADASTDASVRWDLGNAERTDPDLRAHGVNNWNMAISKTTRIGDKMNLMLRLEAFNLFNRVQFGPPNTQASTAATSIFGQVTSQANQPRLMQLGLRLTF